MQKRIQECRCLPAVGAKFRIACKKKNRIHPFTPSGVSKVTDTIRPDSVAHPQEKETQTRSCPRTASTVFRSFSRMQTDV